MPSDDRSVSLTIDSGVKEHENASRDADDQPVPGTERKFSSQPEKPNTSGCTHAIGSRNLVVCIDGTANQFGDKNTNVIELYNLILKEDGDNQKTWYNSGIGTYVRPSYLSLDFYKQWVFHTIDLAIAWDFKKTVLGAYRWLSDNYKTGDCIFLFGFSRGAYQVRVLSAMIDKVGLIRKGNEMQIPFAYELYADQKSGIRTEDIKKVGQPAHSTSSVPSMSSKAERFKSAFSRKNVKVHFVGAWDTVSSIGVVRGTKMLPGTVDGMTHVCHFRHALALDERRVKFLPEYAYGGTTKPVSSGQDGGSSETTQTRSDSKEVWFAGTHSDIGGGNIQNTGMDRARPPLRWMVFEAGAVGLRTSLFEHELSPNEQINIIESLTGAWRLFEILPIKRLSFTRKENGQLRTTRIPHRGSARKIHPGQKIHSSLLRAENPNIQRYIPKARPVGDNVSFWEVLRDRENHEFQRQWLELDLYGKIEMMVKELIAGQSDNALVSLRRMAVSGDARQNVYDTAIDALGKGDLARDVKHRLLTSTMDVLKRNPQGIKLHLSTHIRPLLSDLWNDGNEEYKNSAQEFVALYTDACRVLPTDTDKVISSVALSSEGKLVVLGHGDQTIRICNTDTGKPAGEPLQGHTNSVTSIAFSPDGKLLISGSDDQTIRIWNTATGKPVGEPLRGHTDWITSVVFSSDGKLVVSAAGDRTIRIWKTDTGKAVGEPIRAHTSWVESLACICDGKFVVCGSSGGMTRIWNIATGKPVGEPLWGHVNLVTLIKLSPNGKLFVSASADNTIRIWDAERGEPVGEPLRGHTDWIRSAAFSSDGKLVVSGSDDRTIRIWDLEHPKYHIQQD